MRFESMVKFTKLCSLRPDHQLHMANGRWHIPLIRNGEIQPRAPSQPSQPSVPKFNQFDLRGTKLSN